MDHSQDSYLLYIEEEIRNTKKLLSLLSNHDTITPYIQELAQIEEDYLCFKSPKRQPPTSVPPLTSIPTDLTIPNRIFTLEELQTDYNGLNGQPAYVALYGVVFDVSNIATWGGATHFGLLAGTDATSASKACGFHNPIDIMQKMPAVGYLEKPPSNNLEVSDPTVLSDVTKAPVTDVTIPNRLFTLQELENKYNGKNGNLSYVAMNGIVFDITNSHSSHNSKHFGLCSLEDLKGARHPRILGKVNEIGSEVSCE